MNKINQQFGLTFVCIISISISCRSIKLDPISMNQENISLRLIDNKHFDYTYYSHNLQSNGIEESKLIFSRGTYTKIGKNSFELKSDSFNTKSVDAQIIYKANNVKNKSRIRVGTDIEKDHSNEYRISLQSDTYNLIFKGLTLDTVLDNINRFTIEVTLPEFYTAGRPAANYHTIRTKPISVEDGQFLDILIPITRNYFYYQDIGLLRLKDVGKYYILEDGKKIKKAPL